MLKYTILKNKEGKFEIYNPAGEVSARCLTEKTAEEVVKLLEAESKLEPHSEPANNNSVLQSPIAKMTRDLLGKNY